MKTKNEVLEETKQFYGTEQYHKFNVLSHLVITDGVKYIAEKYKVFWLLDLIASYQKKLQKERMQVWTLKVEDDKGIAICTDGNNNQLIKQKIPFTDCEAEEFTIWVMNNIILLPSEY